MVDFCSVVRDVAIVDGAVAVLLGECSALMINSTGAVRVNLTPLMTVEDIDSAMTKSPSYRPPGG